MDKVAAVLGLICCPPCPGHIVAKLSFLPPSPPTYQYLQDDEQPPGAKRRPGTVCRGTFLLKMDTTWVPMSDFLEAFSVRTKNNNDIVCVYIPVASAKYTLLYSHGNAADLGQIAEYLIGLSREINCNIMAYDYSGYGSSTGKPYEQTIYNDIGAVHQVLLSRYKTQPQDILLYGQSIGSAPAVQLASKMVCRAVILHAPLMSGLRVFRSMSHTVCFDPFKNIKRITRVNAVVMVIHGTDDEVISVDQGMALAAAAPVSAPPLWINGGHHNDLESFPELLDRLKELVQQLERDDWSQHVTQHDADGHIKHLTDIANA